MSVLEVVNKKYVPVSVFQLFSIGIGPSSSHTVGPMRAALLFAKELVERGHLFHIASLSVELFGSLAMTGKGHATDIAILLGLEGHSPETVDPNAVDGYIQEIIHQKTLYFLQQRKIPFKVDQDLIFCKGKRFPYHSNAIRFQALDVRGEVLMSDIYYSVGGGFVVPQKQIFDAGLSHGFDLSVPYPFQTASELLRYGQEGGKTIAEIMWENELSWRTKEEVREGILHIWSVMKECVKRGCCTEGVLPGGLNVKRRASRMYKTLYRNNLKNRNFGLEQETIAKRQGSSENQISDPAELFDWVSLFALAVNEENAAGGRVVTAPTNGAAGIIPAVLHYYEKFTSNPSEEGIVTFFLTAAAIGILYKEGASLSAAEMGCQGEVGVATSMAAAGLTAALGGSNKQIENAAEIGMEHNLGLTCDPVGGLVQIPCIERNAMGAVKAINASRLALSGDGEHQVSLDQVIEAMRLTGEEMEPKYKETSEGGLALCVSVNLPEC